MKYNKIANTDLNVSALTLGTWVLGGDMWGGASTDQGISAVHAALDCGINMIDTAPIYGFGRSEEIVGRAIKGQRDKIMIATKCGLLISGKRIINDLSPQSIAREIDLSLKRLRTDYIDLYQCHWPDPNTPVEKTMEALSHLIEQRKIRYVGVSNFDHDLIRKAHSLIPIVTTQNHYSMLERSVEKTLLPYCRETGCALLAYGPLAGGILTGKYTQEALFPKNDARSFFYKHYSGKAFRQVQILLNELKNFNRPLNQIAINWVRQQSPVASVLVGSRNPEQVQSNASAIGWDLTPDQLDRITAHLQSP